MTVEFILYVIFCVFAWPVWVYFANKISIFIVLCLDVSYLCDQKTDTNFVLKKPGLFEYDSIGHIISNFEEKNFAQINIGFTVLILVVEQHTVNKETLIILLHSMYPLHRPENTWTICHWTLSDQNWINERLASPADTMFKYVKLTIELYAVVLV